MEAAVLPGHEDWVKALAFCSAGDDPNQEPLTLASGSQDGTIRLWTITPANEEAPPAANVLDDQLLDAFEAALGDMTNEEHGKQVSMKQHLIKVTDEAG
jgi:elongator complex protein 2